jgi:hypothetical protein
VKNVKIVMDINIKTSFRIFANTTNKIIIIETKKHRKVNMNSKELIYFKLIKPQIEKSLSKHKGMEVLINFPNLTIYPKVLEKLQELFEVKKDYFGYYKFKKKRSN